MASLSSGPRDGGAEIRSSGAPAMWPAAAVIAVMFMGSTLLTPLYGLYQERFGFSVLTLTLLYAVYVVGNLAALGFLGRLSDLVGRRTVSLLAIAVGAASVGLFLVADGLGWLFAGRALSGLAVGLGAGAATAWITELMAADDRPRAAAVATGSNYIGLAVGPLLAGTLAEYAPWPLHLPFWAYLAALAATGLAAALTPETVRHPRAIQAGDLRPRLGVPKEARARFLAPAVTVFGTMALVGYFAALAPSVMRDELKVSNLALASTIIAGLFAISAACVFLTRSLASRTAMLAALALFPPTLVLLSAAEVLGSLPILLAATVLAGLAAALGYRGGLQVVSGLAPPDRRAEVVSTYYLCGFAGNALPVIGVGAVSLSLGPRAAALALAAVIGIFAVAAIAWELARTRRQGRTESST